MTRKTADSRNGRRRDPATRACTCPVVEGQAEHGEVAACESPAQGVVAGGRVDVARGDDPSPDLNVEDGREDVCHIKVYREQNQTPLGFGSENFGPDTFEVLHANVAGVGDGDPAVLGAFDFLVLSELKKPEHPENSHASESRDTRVGPEKNPTKSQARGFKDGFTVTKYSKFLKPAKLAMQKVVEEKLKIFNV